MRKNTLSRIIVRRKPGDPGRGWLVAGPALPLTLPVALGRGGIKANKREGDGATPRGLSACGGCGGAPTATPARRRYCRHIASAPTTAGAKTRPTAIITSRSKCRPGSNADRLARADHLYDFLIELDHNTRPRIAGRGSAVFIHAARPRFAPTAGCVALELQALRRLLARLGPRTRIVVE